jgi:aspartyl-tRNA(Asn)/glutamyl-tRNA(Gln) amidotransferase subunit A
MYLSDIYTVPVNIAELPAISVPCGFSKNGLPIGMQLIGSKFSEPTLFNVADVYETQKETK